MEASRNNQGDIVGSPRVAITVIRGLIKACRDEGVEVLPISMLAEVVDEMEAQLAKA